jgi:hypothetical protein
MWNNGYGLFNVPVSIDQIIVQYFQGVIVDKKDAKTRL